MRREDALLYLCCCQDLSAARADQILRNAREGDIIWPEVFSLAREHGVAPIVHRNLEIAVAAGLCVPDEILHKFRLATYRNITVKSRQAERLACALTFLRDLSVDVMALKGVALDLLVYDESWYTVAEDVDLVLRSRRAEGKSLIEEVQNRLDGLGLEYELDQHHDVTLNGALAVDFGKIWRDAMVTDFQGLPLYLMAPEDMLLAVCINSCRKRYFRLRSLFDIAETVKRMPALDWSAFAHKAIEYDCNNITYTALTVTAATVGCTLPCYVMDKMAVGPSRRCLVDSVIRYLLHNVTLRSLSCYTGGKLIGRRFGWSLLLPYTAYHWPQRASKIREALTAFSAPNP